MLIVSKRLTPAFKKTLISAPKPQYVPETSLCDWIIREVAMQDYGMLLCINRNTQMPIVLPGAEFLKVSPVSVLRQVLMFVMAGMGISSIKLTEYVNCIAHGEVSYQNMTADFLVEKAFRAYAPELAKIDVERLDDDQLLNQLGILSLTLGSSTKVFCDLREPKIAPAVRFKDQINQEWRLPAQRKGSMAEKSAWEFDYRLFHQWDDQIQKTPAWTGYAAIVREMRQVNDVFLRRYHDYLEQTEMVDDTRMQQYLRLADVYLNRYLIASHPETLTSDLTAPTAYLFEWLLEHGQVKAENVQLVIDAMLAFGAFIKVAGVYSTLDEDLYRQAVRDGGDRVRAFFKAAAAQAQLEAKDDAPVSRQEIAGSQVDTLVQELMALADDERLVDALADVFNQTPALIDKLLAKMTPLQRQNLARKLARLLTDDHDD
ncbi:hypothetical protein H0G69_04385 [Limosilactobacillus mucosae]|uniref:hypothetical protein n=1 Tax=Limosilactobacillus mucosae TaxID=97478 RepID=UPI0015D567CE|nr:hypothetical protein [Limosilactobacillus mucosae]QLI94247.1 hypothetical protein H0G69_04385 [Limosilactobacillus mucosae]